MNKARVFQQLSDLFAYLLIPGLAVIAPASFSRWIMARVSHWRWFMADVAEAAFQGARDFVSIENEAVFKSRVKQVELLEARDLYMMSCGRSRSVLAELKIDGSVELAKDRVIIGMHWGPSISVLKFLQVAGLKPALPYRPPEKQLLKTRPLYFLFSFLAARYMVKTLDERAVPVGGAGKVLRSMMDQPGSVIVIMDAPPMEGRPTLNSMVLGKKAIFNAGFPTIIADREKEYVFYAISLQPGDTVLKKLELEGPFKSSEAMDFLQTYTDFMNRHLSSDPSQWRIWHVAQQFWR
jgi:hypothetical protein